MKLGFYYHIPVVLSSGRIGMPAFLGLFVDSLAEKVNELVLFMHSTSESAEADYLIISDNVTLVSLGKRAPAYTRYFFPSFFLGQVRKELRECDFLIVRSPSPLAPGFTKYVSSDKLIYMVIGSYKEGLKYLVQPWYKGWLIKQLNLLMHNSLQKALVGKRVIVNSQVLFDCYKSISSEILLAFTTTLTKEDFYFNENRCADPSNIKILFVGRFDLAKGLNEALQALSELRTRKISATLHLVGWDQDNSGMTKYLKEKAKKLDVASFLFFHGRKKTGAELFQFYREADIYILPSYHEGFPRTIWEALANSIPVVCTSVGSIPFFLENEIEVLMVPPRESAGLTSAIIRIISDNDLRVKLVRNGFKKVEEITLGNQSSRIVDFINSN